MVKTLAGWPLNFTFQNLVYSSTFQVYFSSFQVYFITNKKIYDTVSPNFYNISTAEVTGIYQA